LARDYGDDDDGGGDGDGYREVAAIMIIMIKPDPVAL